MANFPPWKAYFLAVVDELIARHGLAGPFLDVGGGRGEVAAHLAARGWAGRVIEPSPPAAALARTLLARHPAVEVAEETIAAQAGRRFGTILMLDVLEHLSDDRGTLDAAAALQGRDGALIVTVPTHPAREWRWDDDLYGHLRRYEPAALRDVLVGSGYEVVEMWDVSFPVFWLLRRAFTALKRPSRAEGTPPERTAASVTVNAWDLGLLSRALSWVPPWRPLFALQRRFRTRVDRGCEVAVLARRR